MPIAGEFNKSTEISSRILFVSLFDFTRHFMFAGNFEKGPMFVSWVIGFIFFLLFLHINVSVYICKSALFGLLNLIGSLWNPLADILFIAHLATFSNSTYNALLIWIRDFLRTSFFSLRTKSDKTFHLLESILCLKTMCLWKLRALL